MKVLVKISLIALLVIKPMTAFNFEPKLGGTEQIKMEVRSIRSVLGVTGMVTGSVFYFCYCNTAIPMEYRYMLFTFLTITGGVVGYIIGKDIDALLE